MDLRTSHANGGDEIERSLGSHEASVEKPAFASTENGNPLHTCFFWVMRRISVIKRAIVNYLFFRGKRKGTYLPN